jgi:hypothetical protein
VKPLFVTISFDQHHYSKQDDSKKLATLNLQGLKAIHTNDYRRDATDKSPAYETYQLRVEYKHNLALNFAWNLKAERDAAYDLIHGALEGYHYKNKQHLEQTEEG